MNPLDTLLFVIAVLTCVVGATLPFAMGKLPYAPAIGPFMNSESRSSLTKNFGAISIGVTILMIWAAMQSYAFTGKMAAILLTTYYLSLLFHYPKIQTYFSKTKVLSTVRYYSNRKHHFFYYDVLCYVTAYIYLAVVGPYIGYIAYLLMFG